MDMKEIFRILNIEETKDEKKILAAYRSLLKETNPEDNPTGFQRLREAYEAAISFARSSDKREEEDTVEKTEVDYWIDEFDEIYNNLYLRRDEKVWRERFKHPLCEGLDTFYEVREKLLAYFMNHSNLPHKIWLLCDEVFQIRQDIGDLLEVFPGDYIQFVLDRLEHEEFLYYEGFEYLRDIQEINNEDEFIGTYFKLRGMVEEGDEEECQELIVWLTQSGIYHPYGLVEGLRLALRMGQQDAAKELVGRLEDEAKHNYYIAHYVGEYYEQIGEKDKAFGIWKNIWDKEKDYAPIGINLARYYMEQEEYFAALECLEENFGAVNNDEYAANMYQNCCSRIVYLLWEKAKEESLSFEEIQKLCLSSAKIKDYAGAKKAALMAEPKTTEESYAYHYNLGISKRGLEEYKEAKADYLKCLKMLEEGKVKQETTAYEYSKLYQGLLSCELGMQQQEQAEAVAREAVKKMKELNEFHEWKEFNRDLAQLLTNSQQYEKAVDVCDTILEADDGYFPAYVLRQKSCYYLDKGQQVIDDFYRAKEIYPKVEQMYFYAADIFLQSSQAEDAMSIICQARENEVEFSCDLLLIEIKALRRLKDTPEDIEENLERVKNLYRELKENQEASLKYYELDEVIFEKGVLLQRLERYGEAMECYEEVLEQNETHFGAVYSCAWCKYKTGDPRGALKLYEKLSEVYKNVPGYYYERGLCYEELGNRKKARELFEETLKMASVYSDACEKLGEYWLEEYEEHCHVKDFEKAITYITREIEDEATPYHLLVRADWYKRNRYYEEAIEDLKRALQMDPESIYLRNQLARVYTLNNEYDKAEEYYNKVIEVMDTIDEEKRIGYYEACIGFFRRRRKYDVAMELCQEGLSRYPGNTDSFYEEMGEIYEAMGKTKEAIEAYQKCTENDNILENIAHASLKNGYRPELEEYYEKSKKYYDDEAAFYVSWAVWKLFRVRRYEEAIPLYTKAAELETDRDEMYEHYVDIATACILSGKEKEAREQAEKAIRFQEEYLEEKGCSEEEFLYNNGKVPYKLGLKGWEEAASGNIEVAISYFEEMLKTPKCFNCNAACCFESYLYRARCYEIMGDNQKALELFQKVIEVQGNHWESRFAIQDLEKKLQTERNEEEK